MARTLYALTSITPANLFADAEIPSGWTVLLDDTSELQLLEWTVAKAISALLPDELLIDEAPNPNGHGYATWNVYAALDERPASHGLAAASDPALRPHFIATEWLQDDAAVCDRININEMIRSAVERACAAADAGV